MCRKLIGVTWAGSLGGSWYIINKNKYMVGSSVALADE